MKTGKHILDHISLFNGGANFKLLTPLETDIF